MEQKEKRTKINNNNELFDLCWKLGIEPTEDSWTNVRHFLHDNIEDKERIQDLLRCQGHKNQTPLHLILTINNPPMDIVTMLVELAPETLRMKDAYGCLPLHVASSNRVSLEMLTFILRGYPESAQVVDNEGNLPLHLACFFRTSLLDKVNILIQAYPKGKDIRNLDSSTPSDILREQAFIREEFQFFDDEEEVDYMLLLHQAVSQRFSIHLIQLLLQAFPDSCTKQDEQGMVPLHHACVSNAPADIVLLLLHTNPESSTIRNKQGEIPSPCQSLKNLASQQNSNDGSRCLLHHQAALRQGLAAKSLNFLFRAYPPSISSPDVYGLLPFHYACLNAASPLEL